MCRSLDIITAANGMSVVLLDVGLTFILRRYLDSSCPASSLPLTS